MQEIEDVLERELSSLPQDKRLYIEAKVELRSVENKTFQSEADDMQEMKSVLATELASFPQNQPIYIEATVEVREPGPP